LWFILFFVNCLGVILSDSFGGFDLRVNIMVDMDSGLAGVLYLLMS